MGLFTQRPEEPTEWAGLPAEPERARSGAEVLPMDGTDSWQPDLTAVTGASSASIEIPVSLPETEAGGPDGGGGD